MENKYDVIVLGLGAMGSATLYQLAKRKVKVLGIDQFSPPHIYGSTHGDTRITRQAIGEGEEYVPLVLRSHEIWRELEDLSGENLLNPVGGLIMTDGENIIHHGSSFFEGTVSAANKYNIDHELLDSDDISKKFPQFKLSGKERGYYEKNAGFVRPENCVKVQLSQAEKLRAHIHRNEKVVEFDVKDDKVVVKTVSGNYEAQKLIISAGPWVSELLNDYNQLFQVYRQVLYWFDAEDITSYLPQNCPIYIWEFSNQEDDAIYGFPAVDGPKGGVKIASEQYSVTSNPNNVIREVSQEEIDNMYNRFIEPHFTGLKNRVVKAVSCLYTVTPDSKFIIDFHPNYGKQVVIASPCSGHGFKHSAAIGEVLSELVIDQESKIDISKFSINRFSCK